MGAGRWGAPAQSTGFVSSVAPTAPPLTPALQLQASGSGHLPAEPAPRLRTRGIPRPRALTAPEVAVLALNEEADGVSSGRLFLAACGASVWSRLQCTCS